jgi:hypothetical protein
MKIKKTLALLAALLIIPSVCSCGQDATSDSEAASSVSEQAEKSASSKSSDKDDSSAKVTTAVSSSADSSSTSVSSKSASATTAASSSKTSSSASGSGSASANNNSSSSGESSQAGNKNNSSASNSGSNSSGGTNNNSAGGNDSSGNSSSNSSDSRNNNSSNNSSGNNSSSSGSDSNANEAANNSNDNQTPQQTPAENNASNSENNSSDSPADNNNQDNQDAANDNNAETPADDSSEEEKTYTAEIVLGSTPQISGECASADGSRVVITGGGDFYITGSVDGGQIEVNTTEKVKLRLDGVGITSYSGPAILVTNAKRITVTLAEGSASVLSDVNKDKVNDAVIYSNDTLEIKGKGSLDIYAGNAHGICSDDDVIIENGTINITSVKSGIIANDDITINGGTLNIQGGTNGIKSKGTININGGYSVICGGTKEEKSSVYAAGSFSYMGGYVYAAGNTVTAPTETAYPYIVAGFTNARAAGSNVSLQLNGYEMVNMIPANNFRCIMMLAPEISDGSSFAMNIDGADYSGYTVSDVQNIFTVEE